MNAILSPYVLIMITAAIVCMSIVAYVWSRHRSNSETIPLVLLLLGITEWIIAALLGLVDQNLAHKILWAKVEYIGVVSVPLAVLGYVLYHSGSNQKLTVKRLAWLALIPVITLILAWTNGNHGLIWAKYIPYREHGLVLSDKTYGLGFWIYWVYSYLVLLAATVLSIRLSLVSPKLFRWQSILIVIGILMPWAGNLLYVLHINPFGNLDLTPLAFSITGIALAIGMFQWQLFDIKPIAQAAAIAGMADGLLILDNQNRIMDVNPAARAILGLDLQELVGKQIEQIITDWLPFSERPDRTNGKSMELKLKGGMENRDYEISDSPFYEKPGSPGGTIVFLHDTTNRKRLEEKLREMERKHAEALLQQAEDKFAILYQNMSVGVIYQNADGKVTDMNPAAERILGVELGQLSDLNPIRANVKTIREDGSDIPIEEYPSMVSLKTGKPLHDQLMGVCFQNEKEYRWITVSAMPQFKPGENKPYQVFVTFNDVTEHKRAENALRESEQRFRDLFFASPDALMLIDPSDPDTDWSIVDCNEVACQMNGYTREELVGKSIDILNTSKGTPQERAAYLEHIRRAGVLHLEASHRHRDGHIYPIEISTSIVTSEGRELVLGIDRDITERKQVENALRESEVRFRTLVEQVPAVTYIASIDETSSTQYISPQIENFVGVSPEEYLKDPEIWPQQLHPEDRDRVLEELHQSHESGKPFISEYRMVSRDGRVVWFRDEARVVQDDDGEAMFLQGLLFDITERKLAEEKLRASEIRYRELFNNINSGVAVYEVKDDGRDFIFKNFNRAGERIDHDSRERLIGKSIFDVRPGAEEFGLVDVFRKVWQTGQPAHHPVTLYKDKHLIGWYENYVYKISPNEIVAVFEDVTERKLAEEKLGESEKKYRDLINGMNDTVWVIDFDTTILDVNNAASNYLGYTRDELLSMNISDVDVDLIPEQIQNLASNMPKDEVQVFETWHTTKDGRKLPVEISSSLVVYEGKTAIMSIARDITERKQAEQQIKLQLKRMRALNEIDRAIASSLDMRLSLDILLSEVLSQLNVDAAAVLLLDGYSHSLEYVAGTGFRSSQIRNSRMRLGDGLAGKVGLERKSLRIPDLEEAGSQFKRAELLKDEKFVEYFGVPLVAKGQLKGVLEIFHRVHLYPDQEEAHERDKNGSGLGLAIARQLVTLHGGRIWVESAPDMTSFIFELPV